MNKLDLDAYNLTSDDFRKSSSERKEQESRSRSTDDIKTRTKPHPLVPKLDFQKIFDWRDKANNDNIIMIKISESRITGENDIKEEIDDEDGIQKENFKYFVKGALIKTTPGRSNSLFERKQMIIGALNQAYSDDEDQ